MEEEKTLQENGEPSPFASLFTARIEKNDSMTSESAVDAAAQEQGTEATKADTPKNAFSSFFLPIKAAKAKNSAAHHTDVGSIMDSSEPQAVHAEPAEGKDAPEKTEPLSSLSVFFAVVIAGMLMGLAALAVFFMYVKPAEQVMVPDIEGKSLTAALLEMQEKELYPKLQLRYTDSPDDAGKVLSQDPIAGAIVKAGSRVTLTVSRGVIIDQVENYVGLKLDDVKIKLQTMFTGSSRPLIVLATPVYKANKAEAGTILEQNPPEGTEISSPITVQLVVSRGPAYDYTTVPNFVGLTVRELLPRIAQSKLVFDFSSHSASGDEKAGTVTGQQTFNREYVANYTRMSVELALPDAAQNGLLYGVFSYQATAYPYAVEMKLDAVPDTGDRYNIVTFMHTGGSVTMPYAVPKNTELILTIEGREYKRMVVD